MKDELLYYRYVIKIYITTRWSLVHPDDSRLHVLTEIYKKVETMGDKGFLGRGLTCLSSCIQTKHQDAHLLVTEDLWQEFSHGGERGLPLSERDTLQQLAITLLRATEHPSSADPFLQKFCFTNRF